MNSENLKLKIVTIIKDLGKGAYLSKDVFSGIDIIVQLPSKLRMNYTRLHIGSEAYVVIDALIKEEIKGRYIHTFHDKMDNRNKPHFLHKQKTELDNLYKKIYGKNRIRLGNYDSW